MSKFMLLGGILCLGSAITSCGVSRGVETKYVYIETETVRVDTVTIEVPKEVSRGFVPSSDTLYMGTSLATAWAALDTTYWMLTGQIRNRDTVLRGEVRVVERTVVKDSIVVEEKVVEKPVEVVKYRVPLWSWWLLVVNLGALVIYLIKRYFDTRVS